MFFKSKVVKMDVLVWECLRGRKWHAGRLEGLGGFFNRDQFITGSVLSCLAQDNRSIFYMPLFDIHPAASLI